MRITRANLIYQEKTAVAIAKLLTGGTIANIFTIQNGPILLTSFIGVITTAVSANACDMKLIADPSVGIDTDMCAVVDIVSAALGDYFYIDGTIANAMIKAVPNTALPLGIGMDIPLVIPEGIIDMNLANSDPSTGAITWYMRYKPLLIGSNVLGS